MRFQRKKKRNLLLSVIYRMHKLLPISAKRKLKLYLDLSWIFSRLANETSFQVYQEDEHPFRIKGTDFLLNQIGSNDRVLDLGCKYGTLTKKVAEKAKFVLGVDFDKAAIEVAEKSHSLVNLKFLHGDAIEYLNQHPSEFDSIILSHILEHLDEPLEFLKECSQHVSKIYIELPDFEAIFLNEFRKDSQNSLIYTDEDHISEFDRKEMIALIEQAGLTIISSEYKYGNQKYWCERSTNG